MSDFRARLPLALQLFPHRDADLGSLQVDVRRFRSEGVRIDLDALGQMPVGLFHRPRQSRQNLRLPLAPVLFFLDPHLKPLKTHAIPW
jgi:hypothetical protein